MAFEFNEMSKNGQWGVIGGLCAVIVGLFYMYVWSPNSQRVVLMQSEIAQMQLDNQRTRQVAGQLPDLEVEIANMESRLAILATILPEERQAGALLRNLQSAAIDSNLEIRRFTNQTAIVHDFYGEVPIELDLAGSFHDLAAFFDRISKFGRVVTVGQVSIVALTDGGADTIQATATASTFFFLPEEDVAADAAGGGGGR